jgi:hypothetical protein
LLAGEEPVNVAGELTQQIAAASTEQELVELTVQAVGSAGQVTAVSTEHAAEMALSAAVELT